MTDVEMVGWLYRLDGHEFKQSLGVGEGQGNLVCCSPWDHKDLVMTFLPMSKCLLISQQQLPSALMLEPPKIKSVTVFSVSPSICHEVMDQMP